MPREDALTRGRRLVSEGRLIVSYVSGRSIAAVCRGDSGSIHCLGWEMRPPSPPPARHTVSPALGTATA